MSHLFRPGPRDTAPISLSLYRITGRPGLNDRPALPAGHPLTWGLLTRGTVLEDAEYPFPVFDQ